MNGSHSPINSNSVDPSIVTGSAKPAPPPAVLDDSAHHHHHDSPDSHHHHDLASEHPHVHDPENLKQIINRLSRIEGHIRGVKNMVQENQPCPDVLIQIAAIRGALNRVSRMILDAHLTDCIVRAAETGTIETEIAELKSALDRFLP